MTMCEKLKTVNFLMLSYNRLFYTIAEEDFEPIMANISIELLELHDRVGGNFLTTCLLLLDDKMQTDVGLTDDEKGYFIDYTKAAIVWTILNRGEMDKACEELIK